MARFANNLKFFEVCKIREEGGKEFKIQIKRDGSDSILTVGYTDSERFKKDDLTIKLGNDGGGFISDIDGTDNPNLHPDNPRLQLMRSGNHNEQFTNYCKVAFELVVPLKV